MLRHPSLAAAYGHDQDDGATTGEPVLLDSGDGLLLVGAEHGRMVTWRRDGVKA
jgi:hypothetical protein